MSLPTEYDWMTSAMGNALFSGLDREEILSVMMRSEDAESFDENVTQMIEALEPSL
jgi:hypothetical protein